MGHYSVVNIKNMDFWEIFIITLSKPAGRVGCDRFYIHSDNCPKIFFKLVKQLHRHLMHRPTILIISRAKQPLKFSNNQILPREVWAIWSCESKEVCCGRWLHTDVGGNFWMVLHALYRYRTEKILCWILLFPSVLWFLSLFGKHCQSDV